MKKPEWKPGRKWKTGPKARFLNVLAERTGLEPATPGVTGRYSNQLNYRSRYICLLASAGILTGRRNHGGC